jgi:Class III cytochrome C family
MRPSKFVGYLIFAILVLVSVGVIAEVAKGPENMTLNKWLTKKSPVAFPHKGHQDRMECNICHHKAEENETPAACTTCHLQEAEGEQVKFNDAFHKSCRDCHKAEKKKGNATGPTKCAQCHPR